MKSRFQTAVFILAFTYSISAYAQTAASQELVKSASPATANPATSPTPNAAPAAPATVPTGAAPAANAAHAAPRPRAVPLMISVTDSSGNPVMGLAKEQLTLMDGNQPVQPLNIYKAQDVPLHLGIALLATPGTFAQQQSAASGLAQRVIRPNMDAAFVVSARGTKPWPGERLEWTQDPGQLTKLIQGLDRNAGVPDAFNFEMRTDGTTFVEARSTVEHYGGSAINVFSIANSMMNSDPRPARRVLVIFREPWAHSPGFGGRANSVVDSQLLQVIAEAQQLHITMYVVGLEDPKFNGITDNTIGQNYISLHAGDDGGAGSASRSYDQAMEHERRIAYNAGKSNVDRLAAETGGVSFWSVKKNYPDAVDAIAKQIAGQYIVTFVPGDVAGPQHIFKAAASNGTHVLAQKAFFFGPPK